MIVLEEFGVHVTVSESPFLILVLLLSQIASFNSLIKEIDRRTGMAKCLDIINRLDYLHEDQVNIHVLTCMYTVPYSLDIMPPPPFLPITSMGGGGLIIE